MAEPLVQHAYRVVENAGKPDEHELPAGKGHGFLWRLYFYWRFEERDGGVYVECEAVSLTRNVPAGLGWLIEPIIRKLPRESLVNTLRAMRAFFCPQACLRQTFAMKPEAAENDVVRGREPHALPHVLVGQGQEPGRTDIAVLETHRGESRNFGPAAAAADFHS